MSEEEQASQLQRQVEQVLEAIDRLRAGRIQDDAGEAERKTWVRPPNDWTLPYVWLEADDRSYIREEVYRIYWNEELTTWAPRTLVPIIIEKIRKDSYSGPTRYAVAHPQSEEYRKLDRFIRNELMRIRSQWKKHIAHCANHECSVDVIWDEFDHGEYVGDECEFKASYMQLARIAWMRNALHSVGHLSGQHYLSADTDNWYSNLDRRFDKVADALALYDMLRHLILDVLHFRWYDQAEASAMLSHIKTSLGLLLYNVALVDRAEYDAKWDRYFQSGPKPPCNCLDPDEAAEKKYTRGYTRQNPIVVD